MSRILFKTTWGSDDPTRAVLAFLHGVTFAEAGHDVRIYLLGEAVTLMRGAVAEALLPMGFPPFRETLARAVELAIPIHVCSKCSVARGVELADLDGKNATFAVPSTLVEVVEWADKIVTE